MEKFIIFGLGNPGKEYEFTRHNVGVLCVKYIFGEKTRLKPGKGNFFFFELKDFIGIVPNVYMNLNGSIIVDIRRIWNIDDNFMVISDDFNLDFGVIRFRRKGGAGGHRGLESVIYYLETERFLRLRIGIGKRFEISAAEYVLSRFCERELSFLEERVFPYIKEGIFKYLPFDIDNFENYINNYPWKSEVQSLKNKELEEKK